MKIQIFPLTYEGKKRIGIRPLGFDKAFPALMKKIPGSRWTPEEKCWHIPDESAAYAQLKARFHIEEAAMHVNHVESSVSPGVDKVKITLHGHRLYIYFEIAGERLAKVKAIPFRQWHKDGKYWSVPYTKRSIKKLNYLFGSELHYDFTPSDDVPEDLPSPPKVPPKELPNVKYKDALIQYEEQLMLKRYSQNTIKSYRSHFVAFLLQHNETPPFEITEQQIKDHLMKIVKNNGSESLQNQVINVRGVSLRYIQELLGHNSSKTTEIYTHITSKGKLQIKSPLDDLNV